MLEAKNWHEKSFSAKQFEPCGRRLIWGAGGQSN